jgi:hypothetical protein
LISGVFYSFEPMHYIQHAYSSRTQDEQDAEGIRLVQALHACKLNDRNVVGYLMHVSKPANQFLFEKNQRLFDVCKYLLPSKVCVGWFGFKKGNRMNGFQMIHIRVTLGTLL